MPALASSDWTTRISAIMSQLQSVKDLAQARENKIVEPVGLDNPKYQIAATAAQVNQWSGDLILAAVAARDLLTAAVQAERA